MRAPIILFVYARPEHTRLTVESVLTNPESREHDLIVYSDAAKDDDKREAVGLVRKYINSIKGFKSVTIRNRHSNFGLSKSIIDGVSATLVDFERVIVLEDDMVVSPHFLAYMNEGLDRFEEEAEVISIHGYMYPVADVIPDAFFLRGADCWGWGTWRRGWLLFNPDGQTLMRELKRQDLINAFDLHGGYPFSEMLEDQINKKNDSWAIRWYASAFLANKLTLYPGRSLVRNIGNDSSGTHCETSSMYDVNLAERPIVLGSVKIDVSLEAQRAVEKYFENLKPPMVRIVSMLIGHSKQSRLVFFLKKRLPKRVLKILKMVYQWKCRSAGEK